jgi:hypothetical protein
MSRTFAITFAARQTPESRFSHFEGTETELLTLISRCFDMAKPGYREGVLCVPVPHSMFRSGIIQLQPGMELKGGFEPRREGEEPRKFVTAKGEKMRAESVEIILYSKSVLEEDPEYQAMAEWEVISINASPTSQEAPMPPNALIANHYKLSGGSDTGMTAEEFESLLGQSINFWKDKAMCGN